MKTIIVILCLFLVSCQSEPCKPPQKSIHLSELLPHDNIQSAIKCAQASRKPLFVFFTGWASMSTRPMEEKILIDPFIHHKLKNDFVSVVLYADERTLLPEDFDKGDYYLGPKEIKTIGDFNRCLQEYKFGSLTQPLLAFMDPSGKKIYAQTGYNPNISQVDSIIDYALRIHHDMLREEWKKE